MPQDEGNGRPAGPQSFWSGTISFGLVSIPVNLFPGTRRGGASLRMLDSDGTPLARRYVCPAHEREVEGDEVVRGFELEDGEYVVVTDEELEGLEPRKSRDIDLRSFVPLEQIDPIFFERGYFLTPASDSTKAYRLLAAVMERAGRAGIATFVMRGKEYLVAILAREGILRAETLRFRDEVRTVEEVGLPEPGEVSPEEVRRFQSVLEALLADSLSPEELEDDVSRRLRALVEEKLARHEDVVRRSEAGSEAEPEGGEVVDLMEALRQRLRGTGDERPGRRPPRAAGGRRRPSEQGSLRDLTKEDLYRRARELDLPGRSQMSKEELFEALRGRRARG